MQFIYIGFSGGTSDKEPTCQYRRYKTHSFDPWVGKIPWRRAWQPTPVFLPGESPWTEEPGGLVCGFAQNLTQLKQCMHFSNFHLLIIVRVFMMCHACVYMYIQHIHIYRESHAYCLALKFQSF